MVNLEEKAKLYELGDIHHEVTKMRCGARKTEEVEHYNRHSSETDLVCTEEPGHEGPHKDALCCWRFHQFEGAEPNPEDVWGGELCSCGTFRCETRKVLER